MAGRLGQIGANGAPVDGNGVVPVQGGRLGSLINDDGLRLRRQQDEEDQRKKKQAADKIVADKRKREEDAKNNPFVKGVGAALNLTKPVSQGGINILADIGGGLAESGRQLTRGAANVAAEMTGLNQQARDTQLNFNKDTISTIRTLGAKMQGAKTPEEKDRYRSAIRNIVSSSNNVDDSLRLRNDREIKDANLDDNFFVGGLSRLAKQATIGSQISDSPLINDKLFQSQNAEIDRALRAGEITPKRAAQMREKLQTETSNSKRKLSQLETNVGTKYDPSGGVEALSEVAMGVGGSQLLKAGIKGVTERGIKSAFRPTETGKVSFDTAIDQADQAINGSDVIKRHLAAEAASKDKNTYGKLKRTSDIIRREVLDPSNMFAREDRNYAKATKQTVEQLVAKGQSFSKLVGDSLSHGLVTDQLLRTPRSGGKSMVDIIKKYGEGTLKSRSFNDYAINLRALDELNAGAKKSAVRPNDTKEDIIAAIKEYERGNPDAAIDAKTLKENADAMIDYGVHVGTIDKKFADATKEIYPHYVPIDRIFDENLVRPSMIGGMKTNVAKQNLIQQMTGSAREPNLSFGASVDYANRAVGQGLKNKVDLEVLRRQQEGLFKGDLVLDPELTKASNDMRDLQANLKETQTLISKERSDVKTGKKVASANLKTRQAESKALEEKLITRTRDILRSVQGKADQAFGDVAPLADKLNRKEVLDIADALGQYNPPKLGKTLDKLEKNHSDIAGIRQQIEDFAIRNEELGSAARNVKAERADNFSQLLEIRQDPLSPGQNVVTGLKDGQKFAITVSPQWAEAIASLDTTQQKNLIESGLRMGANVQKTLFTGWAAPVFTLVNNLVKNPAMALFNARRLSPFGARAIKEFVVPDAEFTNQLRMRGAVPENFTQTYNDTTVSALKYAAEGKLNVSGKINLAKQKPGESTGGMLHKLNTLGAFLGNRQRQQIAKGAFINAKHRGFNNEEALQIAANQYNEVMGNFNRVSRFARDIEPLLLYSGATQAGLRSTLSAARQRPIEAAMKASAFASAGAGMAYASLSSPAGQDYYRDMVENKQMYNIENFLTWVAPWASKDPKTNKWAGVYRMPIVPDFRPINKAINEQVYDFTQGKGVDPSRVAIAGFNYLTGNYFASENETGIDPTRSIKDNPAYQTASIAFNKDPSTGKEIPVEDHAGTTGAGKAVGGLFGISGNQGDKLLKQGGFAGKVAQKDGNLGGVFVDTLANNFANPQGTQRGVTDRIDSLVSNKTSINDSVNEALKGGDHERANALVRDYNNQVEALKLYVLQSSGTRQLSDKQKKYIESLRFPMEGNNLSQRSIKSRLKNENS